MSVAVSCPSCGVGLQALGGGRVVLQVCSHCGAVLDAIDSYRLLRKFAHLQRPVTPLALGARGRIEGVDWVVIGILEWAEGDKGRRWTWVDHQLYSPTHGYAWATLEEGHLIFTRRYRGAISPVWISEAQVETAENPPMVQASEPCRYYETSKAAVSFAEGEFTWAVMVGDRATSLAFLGARMMISLTETRGEREVELSTYPPQAETWASFGVSAPKPLRVHPLQTYKAAGHEGFLTTVGAVGAGLGIALMGALANMGQVSLPAAQLTNLKIETEFPVTRTQGLTEILLTAGLDNAWVGVETEVTDPTGAPVFAAAREISTYSGVDEGESWTEDASTMRIYFHPTQPGDYTLAVEIPESGNGEASKGTTIARPVVRVTEGLASWGWMATVTLLWGLVAAFPAIRRFQQHKARWRGSDWSED